MAAQFDLENTLAELDGSGGPTDAVRSSLQTLGDLQRQVSTANPAFLNLLRSEIAGGAANARAIAQQMRSTSQAELAELALAAVDARTRATIERVAGDLFDRRKLDPYLQFASADDEAEYRRREAERKAYIERELARGTPEGTLNAAAAMAEQVKDAGAHGADRSPDFATMRNDAMGALDDQLAAMRAAQAKAPETQKDITPQTEPASDLDEIAAVFRSAGVVGDSEAPSASKGHGLAVAEPKGVVAGRSA